MADLQLYDPLEDAVEAALRFSIKRIGVVYPVVVSKGPWRVGCIIDGHHRSRLAKELGLPFDQKARRIHSEEEAIELARTLNEDRRHTWPRDHRRELVAHLREAGHSTPAIAKALHTSQSTIGRDVQQLTQAGKLRQPVAIRGIDGKERPATRPTPAPTEPGPENAIEAEPCRVDQLRPKPEQPTVRSRRGEMSPSAAPVSASFANAHDAFGRALNDLVALAPEEVALALTRSTDWVLVAETRSQDLKRVTAWLDALLAARPEPFSVVEGGRA